MSENDWRTPLLRALGQDAPGVRSACWWTYQAIRVAVDVLDLPTTKRTEPGAVAGWIENGRGYAVDFEEGLP